MRQKKVIFSILTITLLISTSIQSRSTAHAFNMSQSSLAAVNQNEITLSFNAPSYEISILPSNLSIIVAPEAEFSTSPGLPRIPVQSELIALPFELIPDVEILDRQDEVKAFEFPLSVLPVPEKVIKDEHGNFLRFEFSRHSQVASEITHPLHVEYIGKVRGVHLARISFYPLRPHGNTLEITKFLKVRLTFNTDQITYTPKDTALDPMIESLKSSLLNPSHMSISAPPKLNQSGSINLVRENLIIEVDQPGLIKLTYEELAQSGFPVNNVNPNNLSLTHHAAEVAMAWEGDSDTLFEAGERLLFYADPVANRWASFDTYLLSEGTTAGMRMTTRAAYPSGESAGEVTLSSLFEQNLYYSPNCFCGSTPIARDGDRWVWNELDITKPSTTERKYNVGLSNLKAAVPGKITFWMISYTDTIHQIDHRVEFYLNDTFLGQAEWDGKQAYELEFDIPSGVLLSSNNEIKINLPGISGVDQEGVWLDAFQIDYAAQNNILGEQAIFTGESYLRIYALKLASSLGLRAFQITNPHQTIRLTNTLIDQNTISFKDPATTDPQQYLVVTEAGIQSPHNMRLQQSLPVIGQNQFNGAEYLIISHPDFISHLTAFVGVRQSQGLTTLIQDVVPIYDQFGEGIPTPEAIKAYLQDAYDNWSITPLYVLLVGDGTYDPKHYKSNSTDTFIPPYLADVDPWAGETAADNRFVTVDGTDNLPDILIGRFPVNSTAELNAMLQKTITYDGDSFGGDWSKDILFIADDEDDAGDFPANSDILASYVQYPFQTNKIYYNSSMPIAEMQAIVLDGLNAGSGISVYTGHSSIHQWAIEGFFHYDQVASLTNGNKQPIILEATCFTSFFHMPDLSALDEAFVRYPNGGAVASWGPSGLCLSDGHRILLEGFIEDVFHNHQRDLGLAIQAGRINLATKAIYYAHLIDTQTLLGDPALQLFQSNPNQRIYLPLILR